jgi:hypothetical protein
MEPPKRQNGLSNFLSGVAVLLSTLACLLGGFALYQASDLKKEIGTLSQSVTNSKTAPTSTTPERTSAQSAVPTPNTSPITANNNTGIQPGQFVQFSFGNKAQVELLVVKRIKNPATGNRDAVNVQFRARRLASDEERIGSDKFSLYTDKTTARNPGTSEAYQPVDFQKSTGLIGLWQIKKGSSVDAYVWLKIPEGVDTIDIYVPETQVFKNVPITN